MRPRFQRCKRSRTGRRTRCPRDWRSGFGHRLVAGSGAIRIERHHRLHRSGLEPSIAALKAGSQLAAGQQGVRSRGRASAVQRASCTCENQINRSIPSIPPSGNPCARNPRRSRQACGHRLRRAVPQLETCVPTWRTSLPSRRCIIRRGTWGRLSPSTPPH